jgi:energy-coupling factor transport system substrate-specific component
MKTITANNSKELSLVLIPFGIGINFGIGAIMFALKLPIYLDAVGTILITLLLGWRAGVITGVLSFVLTSILVNPLAIYFVGTQAAIAIYVHLIAKRGGFSSVFKTILSGIGLGIVGAIVSAPVIVYLFGGITGNGPSLIVAYLVASGKTILKSVVLSGLSIEPIDKTLQCLLALFILRTLSQKRLRMYSNDNLIKNGFIK